MSDELTALEAKARNAHIAVEIAHDDALDRALEAGAVLLEIINRGLVRRGQRKELFARTCNSNSTGQVYVRLAENRGLLTESRQTHSTAVRLSIRAALRIIDKGRRKPERRSRTSPEAAAKAAAVKAAKAEAPLPDFSAMTDADWTSVLEALGIDRFLKVMPTHWLPVLGKRMLALEKSKEPKPKKKKHRLATDIRLATDMGRAVA